MDLRKAAVAAKGKIIALDFDGTCVTNDYPGLGRDIGAVPWLLQAQAAGARFVLHTMRSGAELAAAQAWLTQQGIKLWAVNNNPEQAAWTASPKVYAQLYIDDTALGAPLRRVNGKIVLDWTIAGPALLKFLGVQ